MEQDLRAAETGRSRLGILVEELPPQTAVYNYGLDEIVYAYSSNKQKANG